MNESITARGSIYSNPPRIRCGECGVMHELDNQAVTAQAAARQLKFHYTRQSGWVCNRCKPLPRLKDGERNRQWN